MGLFVKHPMVYIETTDIHFMIQHRLASQQIEKEEDEENQTEYQVVSEVPKVGEICQPPAEESEVSVDMINQAQAISDYISEGWEPEYDVEEQWYHMDELDQLANEQLRCMYPGCFYGIGKFKDYEYHITLEDNAKPVIHPPWKIPLELQPKLDKELNEMVSQGIIIPVNGP